MDLIFRTCCVCVYGGAGFGALNILPILKLISTPLVQCTISEL